VRRFRFDGARPFAAGQRRGVDLSAAPGTVVRSACSGRVTHAGPVPGRTLGVSVSCGDLTATHLGLRATAVRDGARVARGDPVGRLGAAGILRLGARVTARRFGWIDPLRLMAAAPPRGEPRPVPPPVGPAPRGAGRPQLAPLRPAPLAPAPHRAPPRDLPALAWLGAALLACGVPIGGVLRARVVAARRRGRREAVVSGR
jgi:murein DD-endopeptidase MepM/ murein hydrolase activator NlpD